MTPAHLLFLSPIPEDERPQGIRDTLSRPWSGEKPHYVGRDAPFAKTVEGYAQWKIDCKDKSPKPCPHGYCHGVTCYVGHYCTQAGCPRSVEINDLIYAIKDNDLIETLRLWSICFPDEPYLDSLADFMNNVNNLEERLKSMRVSTTYRNIDMDNNVDAREDP